MQAGTTTSRRTPWSFAEFFAGIGLMRFGLESADHPWACAYANDSDPGKRDMYLRHFGRSNRAASGITDRVDDRDVRLVHGSDTPTVDLATASFPCTDLSLAGARAGLRSGQSAAVWAFFDVLEQMGARRPPLILLENVVGLLNSHDGSDLRDLLRAMNRLGYAVDALVLDAKWFVPQSRPRLFIVGERDPDGVRPGAKVRLGRESRVVLPEPIDPRDLRPDRLRPPRLCEFVHAHAPSVRWRLRKLHEPPQRSALSLPEVLDRPDRSADLWWPESRVRYLYEQMSERHRRWVDERMARRRPAYAAAFRRVRVQPDGTKRSMAELRTDGLAGCLRTPKGGSARQIIVRAGDGRLDARLLSPRECARLMGAHRYNFAPDLSVNRALYGFGDAVCVDAVRWLADHRLAPVMRGTAPSQSLRTVSA